MVAQIHSTRSALPAVHPSAAHTIHAWFEAQADSTPDAVAVRSGSAQLTYGELDERANRLAHRLRETGAGPESLVGVCLPRDLHLIVAILAILKTGAAYLPLDSEHPAERLAFYLEDAHAIALIAGGDLAIPVPAGTAVIDLDREAAGLEQYSSTRLPPVSSGESLAYVIYTSGSTGTPKGVMVTNHNVVRLFTSTGRWFGFTSRDVWTMFHSCAFDFSVWEIWGALLYGGTLVVVPYAVSRSPQAVAELIRREGVTVLNQTPSAFRAVGRALTASAANHVLRYVIFGGEALDFASLRPWVDRFGDSWPALINMYGITETTVHTTCRRVTRGDIERERGSLIGRPLPDLDILLLDDQLCAVAPGESGEIFVTGEGVARGYLNRPELTAARFLAIDGRPAYRSGDLARAGMDGDLEYLGRVDQQVKIRGFRIELGEISARLADHALVEDALVVAAGAGAETRLVAYCVPRAGAALQPAELRRHLLPHLPDYMIPQAFVMIDAFPLTVNGKIDRARLPEPHRGDACTEPRTPGEKLLAAIWADELGIERVGREANFIELGGDSLAAARVIYRIREDLGADVSFRDFFAAATLGELAARVDGAQPALPRGSIVRVRRDVPLPVSPIQRRLWLTWRMHPADVAYNETLSVRIPGAADPHAMQGALEALTHRHESLRTTFLERGGEVWQTIHAAVPVRLLCFDDETAAGIEAVQAAASEPFDPGSGLLWRATLIRGREHSRLYVTIHHLVWDATSERIFVRDLEHFYRAATGAPVDPLPALPIQCADLASHEIAHRPDSTGSHIDYWKRALEGDIPALEIPASRPRPADHTPAGARLPFRLGAPVTHELRELARREGATVFQVLAAAMRLWLFRYTGAEDGVIGTVFNSRQGSPYQELIGCFADLLPLRIPCRPDATFREVLAAVRVCSQEAQNHAELGFDGILEAVAPTRQPDGQPLFQAGLVLGPRLSRDGEWTWNHYEIFSGHAKFDLSLQLDELDGVIAGHIEYRTALVDAALAPRMPGHLETLLRSAIAAPDVPMSRLPMLTAAEREEMGRWNDEVRPLDLTQGFIERFEAWSRRAPDADALIFEEQTLTYRELDRRADRWAHAFAERGARRGAVVGVCLERSIEAIVSILAIWKCGAAYLPLDPTYPEGRLQRMASDAAPAFIVTTPWFAGRLSFDGCPILLAGEIAEGSGWCTPPRRDAQPEDAAYIIYTSGSTGSPKGVLVDQRHLTDTIGTYFADFGTPAGARCLQFARYNFDASILELLALTTGAALVLAPQPTLQSPRELTAFIRRQRIDYLILPPSIVALLDPAELETVRTIMLGGEACSAELADRWAIGGRRFVHGYGPTEASIASSGTICRAGEGKPSIGRARANSQYWVLDNQRQVLPVGLPGELYIGGACVTSGYLNSPDETAARFVPDPFSGKPGARLYRAGDRVVRRADGSVEFLGRTDSQVKLRGFRIELGEIESCLRSARGVADAVAVLRHDAPGGPGIVAYVVADTGAQPPDFDRRLREHLAAALPNYMIPAAFVVLPQLPLTRSGKIDRAALPSPKPAPTAPPAADFFPAQEGPYQALEAIWNEILGLHDVPPDASFFDLGGHSLSLARMQAAIAGRLGMEIDLLTLLQQSTLTQLSAHIGELQEPAMRG